MLKKWFVLFLTVTLFAACSSSDEPEEPETNRAPLTILAYLLGNNDASSLDGVLRDNIQTLYKGLSEMDESATLLVYWDGETFVNGHQHLILKYETDGKGKINGVQARGVDRTVDEVLEQGKMVKYYQSQNSAEAGVMSTVLRDMIAHSPTDRFGLIAGSHSDAWLAGDEASSRAFGDDEGASISNEEMAEVLISTGKTFEFLFLDSCMMGTIEVCYAFKDAVRYLFVSPLEIPADGCPYHLVIEDLFQGTLESYKNVCRSYVAEYEQRVANQVRNSWLTFSLIDCQQIDPLVQAIRNQVITHKDQLKNMRLTGLQEYGKTMTYKYISVDLVQLMKTLNSGTVPADIQSGMEKVVLYTGCVEKASVSQYDVDIDNYCGLGMYVPYATRTIWNAYFKTLPWYTAAGWDQVNFVWN